MQNKNLNAVDLLKFIFSICVISIHASPFKNNTILNDILYIITVACVPLFFTVSGYFCFGKYEKGNPDSYRRIYMTLIRLTVLFIASSIIYLPIYIKIGQYNFFNTFFVEGTYFHLWFMIALIYSVAITGVLLRFLNLKQVVFIAALLYFVGLLLSTYKEMFSFIPYIDKAYDFTLKINGTKNVFFTGFIFVVLGAVAGKVNNKNLQSKPFFFAEITWFLLALEIILNIRLSNQKPAGTLFFMPFLALFLLIGAISVELKDRSIYLLMRKMSICIYVFHILVIDLLRRIIGDTHYAALFFLTVFFTMVLSYLIVKFSELKYFKWLKYLY